MRSNQCSESAVSTRPLSGIGLGEHDVERADAIGGDQQQGVLARLVDVADLAARDELAGAAHACLLLDRQLLEPLEQRLEVAQEPRRVRTGPSAPADRALAGTSGSRRDQLAEARTLVPGRGGRALHDPVGVVAREPGVDEGEQHALAVGDARRAPRGSRACDRGTRRRPSTTRVISSSMNVEQPRGVGEDHPLGARVGDVALVPQRHVLERGDRMAPDHAGETRSRARRRPDCACAASRSSPSGRRRTAPAPRAPRCAPDGGSRSRSSRASRP